ncbi:unnamed protein product [Amoebophrya sp. A120]|nr:unnamed protein product [Amoebophrya sp. A120]|eukprot:GSA120T00008718001.1
MSATVIPIEETQLVFLGARRHADFELVCPRRWMQQDWFGTFGVIPGKINHVENHTTGGSGAFEVRPSRPMFSFPTPQQFPEFTSLRQAYEFCHTLSWREEGLVYRFGNRFWKLRNPKFVFLREVKSGEVLVSCDESTRSATSVVPLAVTCTPPGGSSCGEDENVYSFSDMTTKVATLGATARPTNYNYASNPPRPGAPTGETAFSANVLSTMNLREPPDIPAKYIEAVNQKTKTARQRQVARSLLSLALDEDWRGVAARFPQKGPTLQKLRRQLEFLERAGKLGSCAMSSGRNVPLTLTDISRLLSVRLGGGGSHSGLAARHFFYNDDRALGAEDEVTRAPFGGPQEPVEGRQVDVAKTGTASTSESHAGGVVGSTTTTSDGAIKAHETTCVDHFNAIRFQNQCGKLLQKYFARAC